MEILSVFDPAFRPYGRILPGYDTAELLTAMEQIPLPEQGTAYRPGIECLEACGVFRELRERAYGGMPLQLGMCWGRNTKLREEIGEDGVLDTAKVRAFRVPAGAVLEVYATTLHFAPCHVEAETGFRVAVGLPLGTNTEKPDITPQNGEDRMLWAKNKWLLAHPEAKQAALGAWIGLRGENIDLNK